MPLKDYHTVQSDSPFEADIVEQLREGHIVIIDLSQGDNITALKCDLYYNSLVPVVLANKLVSLADHPSSDLLKAFAQEKINK